MQTLGLLKILWLYINYLKMKKLIMIITIMILTSFSVLAIVGHPAAQIFPGLFGTGNYTFGTNVLFIDGTNNRVGIGTNSPNYRLHVDASDKAGSWAARIHGDNNALYLSTAAGAAATNDIFSVRPAGGGATFVIENSGEVGIGTDSPLYNLDVNPLAADISARIGYVEIGGTYAGHPLGTGHALITGPSGTYTILGAQGNDDVMVLKGSPSGVVLIPDLAGAGTAKACILSDGTLCRNGAAGCTC